MKHYLTFLMLLLICASCFASSPYFSPVNDGSHEFALYGYYKANNSKSVVMSIYDATQQHNLVYRSGTISLVADTPVVPEGDEEEPIDETVFTWSINVKGYKDTNVTIVFTFTALRALYNNNYYVPKHQFFMTGTAPFGLIVSSQNLDEIDRDVFLTSDPANMAEYIRSITYTGSKNSENWTESGSCRIVISDYEHIGGVSFHYISDVAVEVTVP